jgi:outer membrane immunogenic protein
MRKIFNIDPVRDPISNFYRSSSRVRYGAHLGAVLVGAALLSSPILAGAAMAADMPMNMPMKAAPAPVFNWTGCYVGINGGAAAGGSSFTSVVDPGGANPHLVDPADLATASAYGSGSANDLGFIGGGQAGCNLQTGAFVVGIEGDWDYFRSTPTFSNPNGVLTTGDTVTITQSLKTSSLATIRPRLGIVSDRTLLYVTGGAAFAKVSYTQTYSDTLNNAVGAATGSTTLVGWTVGAGWEWAWTDHVTIKTEYLFAKFPTISALGGILDTAGGANVLHGSSDLTIQTARLGLNYRF